MKYLQLFDVNNSIGLGAYEKPEFPGIKELLAHMDYLGVEKSLVWHYEARDSNPTWGNRNLIAEIDSFPNGSERLVPALTITPACFFERGVMDFLKENMANGKTKALRIFPDISRFPIRQIERILLELAQFHPVLFTDCRVFSDELSFRDIEYLALKIPEIKFVLTQKMWPGFGSIIDLMWRCDNVYTDISWVHMRENIELLVNNFGAERVLFGTGYKAHYGAAIAALVYADITPEQREMIAHGNLEKMLDLPQTSFTIDGDVTDKPLWDKCRQGLPIDVEIIDAHAHIGPTTRGWFMPENDFETQLKKLVTRMDQLGVDAIYTSSENALFSDCVSGNRIAEEKTKPYRDKIFGYLVFNPLYGDEMITEFDTFFAGNYFKGFKLLPGYWKVKVTDPSYIPVWEYADKHSLPILCHTWDDSYNSPRFFKDIAPKYPNAKFLLGHSGGGTPGRYESIELAAENPNVFLEFCGSFTTPVDWVETFDATGFEQVVYGSDTDAHDQAWELGRLLSMPIPDQKLIPVLSVNMKKILTEAKLGKTCNV